MSKVTVIPPFELPVAADNTLPVTFYDHLSFEPGRNNLPPSIFDIETNERRKIAQVAIVHAIKAGFLTPVKLQPQGVIALRCDYKNGFSDALDEAEEVVEDSRYVALVKETLSAYSSEKEMAVESFSSRFSGSRWSKDRSYSYAAMTDIVDRISSRLRDPEVRDECVVKPFGVEIKPTFAEHAYFTSTSLITTGAVAVGVGFLMVGNPVPLFLAAGVGAATHSDLIVDAVKDYRKKKAIESDSTEVVMHSSLDIFVDYLAAAGPNGSKYLYEESDENAVILEHLIMMGEGQPSKWVDTFGSHIPAAIADTGANSVQVGKQIVPAGAMRALLNNFK